MALRDNITSLFSRNSKQPQQVTNSTIRITDDHGFGSIGEKSISDETCITPLDGGKMYRGIVYAAMQKRANATAKLMVDQIETTRRGEVVDDDHDYLKTLDTSEKQSNYQFFYELSILMDLTGNGYIQVDRPVQRFKNGNVRVGKPRSLESLRSSYVTPQTDRSDGSITHYEYKPPNSLKRYIIEPEQMIHIRDFNPFETVLGRPITLASDASAYLDRESSEHTATALKQNLSASGIMGLNEKVDNSMLSTLEDKLFSRFSGKRGTGKPIVSNGSALTWTDMRYDLDKMALESIKNLSREELAAVYGVSKTMLGIEQSGVTRDSSKIQRQLFYENTVIPRAQLIVDALNQDYKNRYKQQYGSSKTLLRIKDMIDLDSEEQKEKIESQKYENARKAYELGVSRRYIAENILDIPQEDLNTVFDHEPTFVNEPEVVLQPRSQTVDNSHKHDHEHKEPTVQEFTDIIKNNLTVKEYNEIIKAQQTLTKSIVAWEKSYLKAAIADLKSTNAVSEEDEQKLIDQLTKAMTVFYTATYPAFMRNQAEKTLRKFGLNPTSTLLNSKIKKQISQRSLAISKSHNATVASQIDRIIANARELGSSRTRTANEIRKLFNDSITKAQATRISVTETAYAFNEANFESDLQLLEENGVKDQYEQVWTVNSSNPCPSCIALSGTTRPFGNDFFTPGENAYGVNEDGSQYKVKTWGQSKRGQPPLHPNCLCTYDLRRI